MIIFIYFFMLQFKLQNIIEDIMLVRMRFIKVGF